METAEAVIKYLLPGKEGILGKDIVEGGVKYAETMFYTEGMMQQILDRFMAVALAQQADLQEIHDLYTQSQVKYPDSWWVKRLEPVFHRLTLKDSYDLISMHLRIKMMATLDKMEADKSKILARLNSPNLMFDELRMMVYNWRLV